MIKKVRTINTVATILLSKYQVLKTLPPHSVPTTVPQETGTHHHGRQQGTAMKGLVCELGALSFISQLCCAP